MSSNGRTCKPHTICSSVAPAHHASMARWSYNPPATNSGAAVGMCWRMAGQLPYSAGVQSALRGMRLATPKSASFSCSSADPSVPVEKSRRFCVCVCVCVCMWEAR